MNEEEKQAYKDQLKRMGKKIADDINDEIKKKNLIEHTYPNFAAEINTEDYERRYELFYTALTQAEINIHELEGPIKGLKKILYDLRRDIYTFEDRESIHYEIALARTLARRGNLFPEQVAPKHLEGLPNLGSVGGKKRTKRAKRKKHSKKNTKKKKR